MTTPNFSAVFVA